MANKNVKVDKKISSSSYQTYKVNHAEKMSKYSISIIIIIIIILLLTLTILMDFYAFKLIIKSVLLAI